MIHNCKNPKYCPYCRQKVKSEVFDWWLKNPEILLTIDVLQERFDFKWWIARNVLYSFEKNGIAMKKYCYNKRMTTGSGIKPYYILIKKNYRPIQVNSKSWLKVF